LLPKRYNFCDIGHKYATFELESRVLIHLFLIFLVLLILLSTNEPVFGFVRIELFAAKKNTLEKVNRVLLTLRAEDAPIVSIFS
jgi:hypothetical protein